MAINAVPDPKQPPPAPGAPPRGIQGVRPATKPGERPAPKKTSSVSLASKAEIEKWFLKTYLTMGTVLAPFKPALANQVLISAEKCAAANAALCMENPTMRKAISALMVTSVWGAVITAHLPILLVIAAEFRTDDEGARWNQQTMMGFAALLSQGGDEDATVTAE